MTTYVNEEESFLEKYLSPKVGGDKGACVVCAFYLGAMFMGGASLFFFSKEYYDMGAYMMLVAVFHLWEYLYNAIFKPDHVTVASFLIDHSKEFFFAFVFSYLEYFVEKLILTPYLDRLFGESSFALIRFVYNYFLKKGSKVIVYPSIIAVVCGQIIRTVSMYQCGNNFSHRIEIEKRDDHILIDTGLYKYFRHPSYFGWFYWSVFTQLILFNPISFIGFCGASWYFFNERIQIEEYLLVQQFGKTYEEYRKKTKILIPFIKTRKF